MSRRKSEIVEQAKSIRRRRAVVEDDVGGNRWGDQREVSSSFS